MKGSVDETWTVPRDKGFVHAQRRLVYLLSGSLLKPDTGKWPTAFRSLTKKSEGYKEALEHLRGRTTREDEIREYDEEKIKKG